MRNFLEGIVLLSFSLGAKKNKIFGNLLVIQMCITSMFIKQLDRLAIYFYFYCLLGFYL